MTKILEEGEIAFCSECDAPIGYDYPDHDYGCKDGDCPRGFCPCA